MEFNWAEEVEKEIGPTPDKNVPPVVTTPPPKLDEPITIPPANKDTETTVPDSSQDTITKEQSQNPDDKIEVQSVTKSENSDLPKTELAEQKTTEQVLSTSHVKQQPKQELVNLNALPSPNTKLQPLSPRVDKITKDMIGRPRFRPIVHYKRTQNLNFVYNAVMGNYLNNGIANEDPVVCENYNYENPSNIQYMKNDYVSYPPTHVDNINTTVYHLPENVPQSFDQNTVCQYDYSPNVYEPYYPCGDNISTAKVPSRYLRIFDGSNQIIPPNRVEFRRQQAPVENVPIVNYSPRAYRRNTRKSRMDQFMEESSAQNLYSRQLKDEEDKYLLNNMDLGKTHRGIRSPRSNGLNRIETGCQATAWDEYLLIAKMTRLCYKFKSCTNIPDSKSLNKQQDLLNANQLQNIAKDGTISKLNTQSIGMITESLIRHSRSTQTNNVDIKKPFKNIIPTKYKTQLLSSKSSLENVKCKEISKKSFALAAKTPTPKFIKNTVKVESPRQELIQKLVESVESIKTPINDEYPIPQRFRKVMESTTKSSNPTNMITETSLETSSIPVTTHEEDDGIPIVPRRRNRQPGEPANVSYAAVVASKCNTSSERERVLKHTEVLKSKDEVRKIEFDIPSSNNSSPITYGEAAAKIVARKQSPRPSRENNPIVPSRSNNQVILELTINQRLMPNSLKNNFQFYMKHGLQFKSIGRQTILMIFHNEWHAKEVLARPCGLGTIVPISQASEKSQEAAFKYYNSRRRFNTSDAFNSGYKK